MTKNKQCISMLAVLLLMVSMSVSWAASAALKIDGLKHTYQSHNSNYDVDLYVYLTSDTKFDAFNFQVKFKDDTMNFLTFKSGVLCDSDAVWNGAWTIGASSKSFKVPSKDPNVLNAGYFAGTSQVNAVPATDGAAKKLAKLTFTVDHALADAAVGKTMELTITATDSTDNDGWYINSDDAVEFPISQIAVAHAEVVCVKEFNAFDYAGATLDNADLAIASSDIKFTDIDNKPVAGTIVGISADGVAFGDSVAVKEGTFTLSKGTVTFKPVDNLNGVDLTSYDVVIYFKGQSADGAGDVNTITITVNPVDDDPVIAIDGGSFEIKENDLWSMNVVVDDPDTDWDLSEAKVFWGEKEIEGSWKDGLFSGAAFDSATVNHKEDGKALVQPVVVKLDKFTSAGDVTMTVADVDQKPFIDGEVTVELDKSLRRADNKALAPVLKGEENIKDNDAEDSITLEYVFNNGAFVGQVPAEALERDQEWTVEVFAYTNPYGDGKVYANDGKAIATATTKILNSAPTAADEKMFIQMDGEHFSKSATIAIADVDKKDTDNFVIEEATGKYGKVTVAGKTVTYTVDAACQKTEFDDEAIALTVKNEGDDVNTSTFTLKVTYRKDPPPVVNSIAIADAPAGNAFAEDSETCTFVVNASATDSQEEGAPAPSGISAFTWTLVDEDKAPVTGWTLEAGSIVPGATPADAYTQSYTVTFPGYDTITGNPRAASRKYTLSVAAADGNGAISDAKSIEFTIADVDQLADAVAGVKFDKAAPKSTDDIKASFENEPEDADKDAIVGYDFEWTVKDSLTGESSIVNRTVADKEDTLASSNFKKNDEVSVRVSALTNPYGETENKNNNWSESIVVTVANTAPALVTKDQICVDEDADEASIELAKLVDADDIDVTESVDTLTYEIGAIDASIGTLVLDGENVKFKPAADYAWDGVSAKPSFSVLVDDGTEKSNVVEVEIEVKPVNDPPTVEVADVYISPEKAGSAVTQSFTFNVGGGDDEKGQKVSLGQFKFDGDKDGKKLLEGELAEPVFNQEDKTVTFTFNVAADAEIGATGAVNFSIVDDGDPNEESEVVSFKITLTGTPWYPIFEAQCKHPDVEGVVVRITDEQGKAAADVVVQNINANGMFELTPALYYASGCKGLKRATNYTFTVYHWNAAYGMMEKCEDAEPEVKYVTDYANPAKPTVEFDAENETLKVTAPLASGFVVLIREANGDDVTTIWQDFEPSSDGMMETVAEVDVKGLKKGVEYQAVAGGYNPEGDISDDSDVCTFKMTEEGQWSETEEGFYPPMNWNQAIATNSLDVTFKWPANARAQSYKLILTDGNGSSVKEYETYVNSLTIDNLAPGTYRWCVESSNGERSIGLSFSITREAGNAPVLGNTHVDRETGDLVFEQVGNLTGEVYSFETIYFRNDGVAVYEVLTGRNDGNGNIVVPGTRIAEGYILIRAVGSNGDFQMIKVIAYNKL